MTSRGSVPHNVQIRIVTDGACRGNPGPGGWAALIVRSGNAEEIGGHVAHTTNNRMELMAAVEGLRRVPPNAQVQISTDSTYLIDGATQWLHAWKRRKWLTLDEQPVQHQDLWQELEQLAGRRVQWNHVRGHTGDPENERVNALAQAFADNRSAPFGTKRPAGILPDGQPRYLSLVAGRLMRHTTWEECKVRVHGVSATKYKKCSSYAEELTTIQGWGLSAADLEALGNNI